eukprot:TRINITY_DN14099_c0_g1_i1.p1 TRINITY_DN14099_c0_g1~~TRINITY_DN14099_c0_g1_i1.p1  ORF type:complete len:686 (+),score=91.98 TRINITY_DN14099_c0_g1_i1:66-2123(+)
MNVELFPLLSRENSDSTVQEGLGSFLEDAFRRQTEMLTISLVASIREEMQHYEIEFDPARSLALLRGRDTDPLKHAIHRPSRTSEMERAQSDIPIKRDEESANFRDGNAREDGRDDESLASKVVSDPVVTCPEAPAESEGVHTHLRRRLRTHSSLRASCARAGQMSLKSTTIRLSQLVMARSFRGNLEVIVKSAEFDIFIMFVLVTYAVSLSFLADHALQGKASWDSSLYVVFDITFFIFFALEIILKVVAFGRRFLTGADRIWNIIITVLVLAQIVELILTNRKANMMGLRLMRFFRLTRVVRAVRLVGYVQELRLIVSSVLGSLRHVSWTMVLITLIAWMAAISITLLVGETQSHCNGDSSVIAGHCSELFQTHFGSLGAALFTLIASIAGGLDWHSAAIVLLNEVGIMAFLFMVLYVVFVVFALVNAVTGVFVDSALRASEQAEYDLLSSMAQNIFKQASKNEDAAPIDRLEFLEAMEGPTLRKYFANLDVNIEHPQRIFDVIDENGSGSIEVSEFVECIHRMKGNTKALDFLCFVNMWRDAHEGLARQVDDIEDNLSRLANKLTSNMGGVPAPLRQQSQESSLAKQQSMLQKLVEEVHCQNQAQYKLCKQILGHEQSLTREMTKLRLDQVATLSAVSTLRARRHEQYSLSPTAGVDPVICGQPTWRGNCAELAMHCPSVQV